VARGAALARIKRQPGPQGGAETVARLLAEVDGVRGKVGFFEGSKYPDGTPVAYVAAIHEFGSKSQGIPARPFLRPTIAQQTAAWRASIKRGAKAITAGTLTPAQFMDALVQLAAGNVAQTISKLQTPALAEATVAARLRGYADQQTVGNLTKPLVHTGILINAVTGVVEA